MDLLTKKLLLLGKKSKQAKQYLLSKFALLLGIDQQKAFLLTKNDDFASKIADQKCFC